MKLLIVTQAVDTEDPVLGFFVRWIEEFAKHVEHVEVICLKLGKSDLPKNVRVHSLGKENGVSRVKYIFNFYRYIWQLRHDYDTVFVHMNQEYVLLAGKIWWLFGKRIILWRNHRQGSFLTHIAGFFARSVCYTSPEAYVARFSNAYKMPIGIDTNFFMPPASLPPNNTILFHGRLDPIKKAEVFISALSNISLQFHADLYGSTTQTGSQYAKNIITQAQPLVAKEILVLHQGVRYKNTRELYQSHAIYVNLTPPGSFDKTIGEAMASGCVVVSCNSALRGIVHPLLMVLDVDVQDVARGISAALSLSAQERTAEIQKLQTYIEKNHSLERLISVLRNELAGI